MQTHHIFGGKTRLNRKANLIRLSYVVHDWAHMRPVEMKIACLWKQRELGVLDWESLNVCAGLDVRNWVENQEPRKAYEWMKRELLS